MTLGAALALVAGVTTKIRDSVLEMQALEGIAIWAEQFTPTRSLIEPEAVLLEIGGCLGYFGGLNALLDRLKNGIHRLGYCPVITVAPTGTASLLFARVNQVVMITEPNVAREALRRLPIRALSYSLRLIEKLEAIGIKTIGDYLMLPRDGIARRYGQELRDIIDRAMGNIPDPQKPFISPDTYSGKLELLAPIWETDALLFAMKRLNQEMCGWLAGKYHGVITMQLHLIHEDIAPTEVRLNVSTPTRNAKDLLSFWRERLSQQKLPDRVEAIVLKVIETMPLHSHSLSLLQEKGSEKSDVNLLDKLRARLGDNGVSILQTYADHRPEFAWRIGCTQPSMESLPVAPRPVWLLTEPASLGEIIDRKNSAWVLMDGPERIEAGWWDGRKVCRDYYVARNSQGQTVWIYRDWRHDGAWFLHGLFA